MQHWGFHSLMTDLSRDHDQFQWSTVEIYSPLPTSRRPRKRSQASRNIQSVQYKYLTPLFLFSFFSQRAINIYSDFHKKNNNFTLCKEVKIEKVINFIFLFSIHLKTVFYLYNSR